MSNCYCKKDYIKGEGNVFGITEIRMQKMKNVSMASFYCVVSKIWKKLVFSLSTKN